MWYFQLSVDANLFPWISGFRGGHAVCKLTRYPDRKLSFIPTGTGSRVTGYFNLLLA